MKRVLEFDWEEYIEEELFIALHSALPPCQFAYWLNKELSLHFRRALKELNDNATGELFPLFEYKGEQEEKWFLIANKVYKESNIGLFAQMEEVRTLIKELPKVDYFIRISNCNAEKETYFSLLEKSHWVDAMFEIFLLPEGKVSPKEMKKLNEIKAKLIF